MIISVFKGVRGLKGGSLPSRVTCHEMFRVFSSLFPLARRATISASARKRNRNGSTPTHTANEYVCVFVCVVRTLLRGFAQPNEVAETLAGSFIPSSSLTLMDSCPTWYGGWNGAAF